MKINIVPPSQTPPLFPPMEGMREAKEPRAVCPCSIKKSVTGGFNAVLSDLRRNEQVNNFIFLASLIIVIVGFVNIWRNGA